MLTHMFWAYGDFSRMEKMCANSFISNGYELQIWTYGDEIKLKGAKVRNAREILPESTVFLNLAGSYAGFSDLFRYSVLCTYGGLYVDTDVVALRPVSDINVDFFLVSERKQNGDIGINGNVIMNPYFQHGNLIDLARVYSERFPKNDITWSEIGPDLLDFIRKTYHRSNFYLHPPEYANSINWWDSPNAFITENCGPLSKNSYFLHLYNEMWRRAGVDKNAVFPSTSLYEQLAKKYL